MMSRHLFRPFIRRYCKKSPPSKEPNEGDFTKLIAIEKFQQKAARVAILGVDTPAGEGLALLLKQNPLISHLYLYGDQAHGIAADLEQIDTRTMVASYEGNDIDKAVRRAEIIMMMSSDRIPDEPITAEERFRDETNRVIEMTKVCTIYAPKSIICVCIPPVSLTVPLVVAVFKKTYWYHPGRIIGSTALQQIELNSLVARYYDLDPSGVQVPIVGGPDLDCMVPLFSRATPVGATLEDAEKLTKMFKKIPRDEPVTFTIRKTKYECAPMANSFALNRMITALALGILGDQTAHTMGFVRTKALQTCKHLVSTVRLGTTGIYHNYGIPRLTGIELALLEKASLLLDERDLYAQDIFNMAESMSPISVKTSECG